jgi:hypothetical protein
MAAEPERPAAPPVVYFWAPVDAPAEVGATRRALETVAREQAGALVDLSPARPAEPRAPALITRAIAEYDGLRFDAAEQLLVEAAAEAASTGAADVDAERLSDLFLYRALVATQRGADGWSDLVRAATVDPARQLDPARFPPKTKEAFKRAADAVRAAAWGRIELTAPEGCQVWLDGRQTGDPQGAQGEHYLRLQCPGYQPYGVIVVLARERQEVAPALVRIEAPDAAHVAELAARDSAGAKQQIVRAAVTVSAGVAPVLWLEAVDTSGKVTQRAAVTLAAGGAATGDATAALRRLIQPAAPVRVVVHDEPRAWYRRPWVVWGLAGVLVTAAVLIPLLADDGTNSYTISPGGDLWP